MCCTCTKQTEHFVGPSERVLWCFGLVGRGERTRQGGEVEIGAVRGGAGLLTPGVLERTGVHAVEAELVKQGDQAGLGGTIVPGNRQGDAAGRSFGFAVLYETGWLMCWLTQTLSGVPLSSSAIWPSRCVG